MNANIVIRYNLDVRNHQELKPLLKELKRLNIVPAAGFYVAPIRNWGNQKARNQFEDRELFSKKELETFSWLIKNNLSPELLPEAKDRTCIAANSTPSVFAPDSSWYFCTETPLVDKVSISRQKTWSDLSFLNWEEHVLEGKTPCLNCKYSPVCGGACPKEWLENGIPCPPYVENINERLQLWSVVYRDKMLNLNKYF